VTAVETDLTNHTARVIFDDTETNPEQMKAALEEDIYTVDGTTYLHSDISPQEAEDMLATRAELFIVDVREMNEFCGDHIPSSLNYPWSSGVLEERYAELSHDADILVYCKNGGRSEMAAAFLDSRGFTSVYDMGGISTWEGETLSCCEIGMRGAILALQLMAGESPANILMLGDTDGDGKIGLVEVICILGKIAGLR